MSGVWKTNVAVLSTYMRNAMLKALSVNPAAALWSAPKVHLSKDPSFNPGPTDTNATLAPQEATFTGYTAQVPVFTVPVNLDIHSQGLITTVVFQSTGSAIVNTITGYWADDGTNLFVAESRLADAIAVASAGDFVQVDLALPIFFTQTNPEVT